LYRRGSGVEDQRKGLSLETQTEALQDAGSRVIVVIVRIDRFGRRVRAYLNVAEELIKSGAVIHTTESGAELDGWPSAIACAPRPQRK